MKYFLIGCFFISNFVFAETKTWNDLNITDELETQFSIEMPKWTLPSNSFLTVESIIGLDSIKVVVFEFSWEGCTRDGQIEEIEIFKYLNTRDEPVEVGVALDSCLVRVFVENRDLGQPAFF